MVEDRERLEHEQVDAAFEQPVDRLAERRPHGGLVEMEDLAGRRTQRPDRPGDEDVPAGYVAGLAGELRAAPGELAGLVARGRTGRVDGGSLRRLFF